jgi:raffinose/stachyose/melibiose transport system substrate-binding protein
MATSRWQRLKKYPALTILLAAYVVCSIFVFNTWLVSVGKAKTDGSAVTKEKIIIRLMHWQMEPGIPEALDEMAREYEALYVADPANAGKEIEIRQIPVFEQVYFQTVNVQLTGGMPADIIECGMGSWQLWSKFYARYFLPLDEFVDEPNPWNKGTEFEDIRWRDTFRAGMEGGYQANLQTYYRVPLSTFTQRLYINKDLIGKVWDKPFPTTLTEFTKLCDALQARWDEGIKQADAIAKDDKQPAADRREARALATKLRKKCPIAGTKYAIPRFMDTYRAVMTAGLLDDSDVHGDGNTSRDDMVPLLFSGKVSLLNPMIRANFQIMRDLCAYFPSGFMGMEREDAVYMFKNQISPILMTGSWNFKTLANTKDFRVGIADLPMPENHAKYGQFYLGRRTEAATRGGFPLAITKACKNPKEALDYLQFLSSRMGNEKLNQKMEWLPTVDKAEPVEGLKPFMPVVVGYSQGAEYKIPGAEDIYERELHRYLDGTLPAKPAIAGQEVTPDEYYAKYVEMYMKTFRREGPRAFSSSIRNTGQSAFQQLRFAVVRRALCDGLEGVPGPESEKTQLIGYMRIMDSYIGQSTGRATLVRDWQQSTENKVSSYSAAE